MSYDIDPIGEINRITSISRDQSYFICNFNDGWLYFNPIEECGFFEEYDFEYQVFSQICFENACKLLFFIEDTALEDLDTSPDPYYQRIKEIYSRYNVKLPRIFYKFESHRL